MKVRIFTIVLTLTSFFMSTQVNGQVLFEETFDYETDTVLLPGVATSPITGWEAVASRDRKDYFTISDDSLVYNGYLPSGVGKTVNTSKDNGQEIQKSFTESITEGVFYLSFMVNVSSVSPTGDDVIRLFKDGSTTQQLQVKVKRVDDIPVFGLEGAYGNLSCNINTTNLIVVRYTFAGTDASVSDSVELFINPSLGTEPDGSTASLKVASNTNSSSISAIRLRNRNYGMTAKISGIYVTKTWGDLLADIAADNVEVSSVSADASSVSYEDLQFELIDGSDDIYMAHDSIAYGTSDVTITATTASPFASISYTKQTVNPVPGESDTATWVVTAEDGTTTKIYKVAVARSTYHCKAGLLAGGSGAKPTGWSTAGWSYASNTKGNGGLYPGDFILRFTDTESNDAGALITPKFSQVGTVAFSAKFSKSDSTESLLVLTSTDDAVTWDTVKTYLPTDGDIPSYYNETSTGALGRVSLSINKQDVMIRFQYHHSPSTVDSSYAHRTAIDDIACKATDYVEGVITGNSLASEITAVDFMIYPNPASGYIQIKGDVTSVSIYSLSGQLLKQTTQVQSIDISDLKAGIYLVKGDNQIKQLIVR